MRFFGLLSFPPPRHLACIMVVLSLTVTIHIWYALSVAEFANDLSDFLTLARRRFRKNILISPLQKDVKFILYWNYYYLVNKNNEDIFPELNCLVKNCYFTNDKTFLGDDYRKFDAVIFTDSFLELGDDRSVSIPKFRSEKQLYIFTTIESAYNKPACELHNDDFYNWTFTHRLDSTVIWNYFVVRNRSGHTVAPSRNVVWDVSTDAVAPHIKKILSGKRKTAAWLVSHCGAHSLRDQYLSDLQEYLSQFSLHIDVNGECVKKVCIGRSCENMIKENYYFYMAFENSIFMDYVTEKVLHAYHNYAIPIVYGGANYSRFLPEGSYLNAREMNPYILATKMKAIIEDHVLHESYLKWTNLYSIHDWDSGVYHPLCELCAALHEDRAKKAPAMSNFRLWWNGGRDGLKWCLSETFWNETQGVIFDKEYINQDNSLQSHVY